MLYCRLIKYVVSPCLVSSYPIEMLFHEAWSMSLHHGGSSCTSLQKLISLNLSLDLDRNSNIFDKKKLDDPSQLILTFEVTDLVGIVSLLYGMLLHSGAPSRGDSAPPELSAQTLAVAVSGLRMLNHMAVLDLAMLQVSCGCWVDLELKDIISAFPAHYNVLWHVTSTL